MALRALVLSGGGVKGAYQLGALKKWVLEDKVEYDILCGVSVGALNVACLSEAPMGQLEQGVKKLESIWTKIRDKDVKKRWFPFGKVHALWKPSIYNSAPLAKFVADNLNPKAIAESGRQVQVGATSWDSGDYKLAFGTDKDFAQWVVASASFPVFFNPIHLENHDWADGGVRNVTPLAAAIRLGAEEVDIIMCSDPEVPVNWEPSKNNALPGYLLRTLEMMSDQVMRTDLQVCGLKNDLAELNEKYRTIKFRVLAPKQLLVDDPLTFDQGQIQRMIKVGYEDACALTTGYATKFSDK